MDTFTVALESDSAVADAIAQTLRDSAGAAVTSARKRNLDGAAETVIQLVELAFTAGGAVLPLLLPWVTRKRVRKIRLGDLEIENPTPEQVEELWTRYLAEHRDGA